MHQLQKGDYIIILDEDNRYKYIPLEIMGLQYQPNIVAVRIIGTRGITPLNLEECTYELASESYVLGFQPPQQEAKQVEQAQLKVFNPMSFGYYRDDFNNEV